MTTGTVRTDTPIRHVLQAGETLTVTASATSSGRIGRLADTDGAAVPDVPASFRALAAGLSLTVGPFSVRTRHTIEAFAGTLSYSVASAVPSVPTSGTPTDIVEMYGEGAPVDYTDGVPGCDRPGRCG